MTPTGGLLRHRICPGGPYLSEMKNSKHLRYFLYALALLLVILFMRQLDLQQLMEHYHVMGWHIYGVLALSLMAHVLGTLGWLLCMQGSLQLSRMGRYFITRIIGETVSVMNPTGIVAGDALKAVLLGRKGEDKTAAAASIAVSRLVLWVSFLLVLLFVLFLFTREIGLSPALLALMSLLVLMLAATLLYGIFSDRLLLYLALRKVMSISSRIRREGMLSNVKAFNQKTADVWKGGQGKILLAVLVFAIHYLSGALEFYYLLAVLDIELSFSAAMYLEIATSFLRSVMAIIPGQMGVEEYGNKFFMARVGVEHPDVWMTVSIVRRLRQLIWIVLSVVLYLIYFRPTRDTSSFSSTKNVHHGHLIH